jgi:hypothetical protein
LAGETPEPLPSLVPVASSAPPEVARAIDACLSFDPEARPDAEELEQIFAGALQRLLAS